MNELITYVFGQSTELTVESLFRLFLFMLMFELIARLCGSLVSLSGRK